MDGGYGSESAYPAHAFLGATLLLVRDDQAEADTSVLFSHVDVDIAGEAELLEHLLHSHIEATTSKVQLECIATSECRLEDFQELGMLAPQRAQERPRILTHP